MKPIRSLPSVPGHRASRIDKVSGSLDRLRVADAAYHRPGSPGGLLPHSFNVPVVSEVYRPSAEEVAHYQGMVEASEMGRAEGRAALIYDGEHIGFARVRTARGMVGTGARSRGPVLTPLRHRRGHAKTSPGGRASKELAVIR